MLNYSLFTFGGMIGPNSQVRVDAKYVDDHLGELVQDEDLARYIL